VTRTPQPQAQRELKGTPLDKAQLAAQPGKTQQLRYTGSYGDTSFVVNAPEGDPATVYAHHSIWPRKVDPKMPYVETVHADGTPYMEPLTVYAPPGGTVVSSVMPGTAARPPIPTRFASLPEADESPLDNTVYQCQPSGYMVGPVGYHCTPACTDSAMWRSDFGDCSVYRATFTPGGFKDYCGTDKDIAGDNRSLCFRASTCATESAGERAKRALCTCMMCALAYRVDREYAHLVCAPTYTHTRAHARTHTHTHMRMQLHIHTHMYMRIKYACYQATLDQPRIRQGVL